MKEWTDKWPIEPGNYWFYGRRFRKSGFENLDKPELSFVEVRHDSRGTPMYITRGHCLEKSEGAIGLWLKVIGPELPTEKIKILLRGVDDK